MKIFASSFLVTVTLLVTSNVYSYSLKVRNRTPFMIEAKCVKTGAVGVDWVTIAPDERKAVGCGGADCQKGIKVKIHAAKDGWKDCEVKSDWKGRCADGDIDIVLIPKFKAGDKGKNALFAVQEYQVAIVRSMKELNQEIPFECKPQQ